MALADRIAKREETDRIAYEIIDSEAIAREKKTERLRELRLARDRSDSEEA